METKLSVAIITFNEEENIKRCLESVAWADEIVVVDSLSADRTVEVARKFTDKVFAQKFLGHKEQKNLALSKTSNEWVLSLDSDEIISEDLKRRIQEILKDPDADGYAFPRKNYFCGTWLRFGGWYPDWQMRLFRRSKGSFGGINPHDRVILKGSVRKESLPIIHNTYDSIEDYVRKMNGYTGILARMNAPGRACNLLYTGWFPFFALLVAARTLFKFVELYFLKGGIMDGYYGFVVAYLRSAFTGLKEIKIREIIKDRNKGEDR